MTPLHILILRFSSLGDIVLNSSVPSALKDQHGAKIHVTFMTSRPFDQLLEGHPALDQVIGIGREEKISKLIKRVGQLHRERPIDLIIDLHGTLRALAIKHCFFWLPRLTIDKRTFERWILCGFKMDFLFWQFRAVDRINGIERGKKVGELLLKRTLRDMAPYLNLEAQKLTRPLSSLAASFFPLKKVPALIRARGEENTRRYILVAPSASFPQKRWPTEAFLKLMEIGIKHPELSEYDWVITAGPEDVFCQMFSPLEKSGRVFNLQGQTSLSETTQMAKGAALCVGNDTGVPHIAESQGTPSLFILGPTGQQFGFYPHLQKSNMIYRDLWCRPCTTNGAGNCIRSQRFCLTDISPNEVLEKLVAMARAI